MKRLVIRCPARLLASPACRRRLLACTVALSLLHATVLAADPQGAHLDVAVAHMLPGTIKTLRWNGRAILIVRTSEAMLNDLRAQTAHTWSHRPIADPPPAFFALSRSSPARGCLLRHAPAEAPRYAPERLWQGGFYDPCRFGEWDYAGRAIKQYDDQDEGMRRPDLDALPFEIRGRATLRLTG